MIIIIIYDFTKDLKAIIKGGLCFEKYFKSF